MSEHDASGRYLVIAPPIPWERVRRAPELNGHLRSKRIVRIVGPHDRDENGMPWEEKATRGPVDQIRIACRVSPEPEDWAERIASEVQRFVDRFPVHAFTGWIDLHDDESPVRRLARITVVAGRALVVRPTVTWPRPPCPAAARSPGYPTPRKPRRPHGQACAHRQPADRRTPTAPPPASTQSRTARTGLPQPRNSTR